VLQGFERGYGAAAIFDASRVAAIRFVATLPCQRYALLLIFQPRLMP